ncbi:MAG: hypothetical protein RIK87_09915 [Fuerstiella sp.]
MNRFLFFIIVTTCVPSCLQAQSERFPYKARVATDEAYVRSGAGEAFYPTQVLKRDAEVTVRRHDPGGWYMIDPPENSFSWIQEKYIRRLSADQGEAIESNVVVFVGSSFGDETHVWQRKLLAGEKVTILSERQVDTLSGPKNMLKIQPPAREYRWMPGSALIPVGEQERSRHDNNPYNVPSGIVRRPAAPEPQNPAVPAETPSRFSPSNRLVKLKKIRSEQRRLQELDLKFRDMILSDPSQWELETLESEYRDLQDSATYKPVAGQIDLRYPAIQKYRQRKAELDDLKRLTSETERRDAELLARQFGLPGGSASEPEAYESQMFAGGASVPFPPSAAPSTTSTVSSSFSAEGTLTIPEADQGFTSGETEFGMMNDSSLRIPAGSGLGNISATSRYIGAGYLQRGVGEDEADYVLMSPSGKILAHVVPDKGVDLESHVGKSVGLQGARYFDESIRTDRIEVSGLELVRIR